MPNLTNNEFDKILSEYVNQSNAEITDAQITGERFFKEMDAQIYQGISFDELPPGEQFIYNLIAETANEVLEENGK